MRVRHTYLDHPSPIALAHRGFSLDGLENSVEAFQAAVDLGCHYLETDVHATNDDVAIAFHDDTLDRVTDQRGAVRELPWSQVRQARIAGRGQIPTIEDMLGSWPQMHVNIDVKAPDAMTPLVRAIERTRAHHRVCVTSFSDPLRRKALRRISQRVATSPGMRVTALFILAQLLPGYTAPTRVLASVDCLQVPQRYRGLPVVTTRTIEAAHAAGVDVHVWTVNDRNTMHELLDQGVDGIVSDRADLLRDVRRSRGQWPE